MLFTSISNVSTSTAATELSFGAPTASTRTLGGIMLKFGLKFPGAGGTTPTTSTTTSTTTTTTVTRNTTTVTNVFNLNTRPLTSTGINNTDLFSVSSVPLTSTVNSLVTPMMTYSQPDSLINRWNFGLEDEEELFLCQASHVNVWDSPLIENDEEVTDFYEKVEKVKLVQTRLEQELDLILLQQKELEDLLAPLMESVKEHSGSVYLQHIDEKHEKMYDSKEDRGDDKGL